MMKPKKVIKDNIYLYLINNFIISFISLKLSKYQNLWNNLI